MSGAPDDDKRLLAMLREADLLRYTVALYVPADKRAALVSLWLFQAEVERIRDIVSEPLPGEIRLQWWRDVINRMRDGEAQQSPLAKALLATIDAHALQREQFDNYLESMTFDLYDDPMPSIAQFDGFMGETQSVFFQMAGLILHGSPLSSGDAGGHGGVALGVARSLLNLEKHRLRSQRYVPAEMLNGEGVDHDQWQAKGVTPEKQAVVRAFTEFGAGHLNQFETAIAQLPGATRPAFLPVAVCQGVFAMARKNPAKALSDGLDYGPLRTQWALLRAATRKS
ncbi:MAG: phytoene/squalene synthase family protein [Pseudomonadota bacterium]